MIKAESDVRPRATSESWIAAVKELSAEARQLELSDDDANGLTALEWADRTGVPIEVQSKATAQILSVAYVEDLAGKKPSAEFVERFPISFARKHTIMAFATERDSVAVALADVRNWALLDTISRYLRCRIQPLFAPGDQILAAINSAYQQRTGQAQTLLDSLDRDTVLAEIESLNNREDLLDVAGRAPVIKLVNLILFEAVKGLASDVHIQPYEDRLVVRLRIDGLLFDAFNVPKGMQEEVVSRVKVIGNMNIAEKRLPQDGRATVQVGDRLIDLRIASLPSSHGERVVIRLLDKSARLYTLPELGMDEQTLGRFREIIRLEHGLVLVTGPTGSGKSTTLYAALQEINAKDRNVVTLEDPIEYQIEGISQTQINEKKGLTFARGLRNVLRQDPDIIMVGEIRDHETAVMAIQSALTGHLVFSTLHTNDAASAVTRMLDLGIEPYLVSSSLIAVMAQRLVRRVCSACARPYMLTHDQLEKLSLDAREYGGRTAMQGQGCAQCRNTGYAGRKGLFELLVVSDAIRTKIQARANATEIRDVAVSDGMRLLRDDGVAKIVAGATGVEEVLRVTMRTTL